MSDKVVLRVGLANLSLLGWLIRLIPLWCQYRERRTWRSLRPSPSSFQKRNSVVLIVRDSKAQSKVQIVLRESQATVIRRVISLFP
jgi:hypothetical protein